MRKEWKKEIQKILKASITPGEYLNIQSNKYLTPIPVYQAIHNIIQPENRKGGILLPYNKFESLFSEFKKQAKKDFHKASNSFLAFLNTPSKLAKISAIPKERTTRGEDLKFYKIAIDILCCIDNDFLNLIALKSYLIERCIYEARNYKPGGFLGQAISDYIKSSLKAKYKKEIQSCDYIRIFYGIPLKDHDEERERAIEQLNKFVLNRIRLLEIILQTGIKFFISSLDKVPMGTTWFVDVFRESSERYLSNWRQFQRKSKNEPKFQKSYKTFLKYVRDGIPSTKLGYTRKTYRRLRYEVVPQGIIWFLFWIHFYLHGLIDIERAKEKRIKEIRNTPLI